MLTCSNGAYNVSHGSVPTWCASLGPAGWFALNVPSGLTLYWFTNNVLSTAQQLYLKSSVKVNIPEPAAAASTSGGSTSSRTPIVKPKEERIKSVSGELHMKSVAIYTCYMFLHWMDSWQVHQQH